MRHHEDSAVYNTIYPAIRRFLAQSAVHAQRHQVKEQQDLLADFGQLMRVRRCAVEHLNAMI